MNCDTCEVNLTSTKNARGLDKRVKDGDAEKHYSLSIKADTLARLIQRQHLTIADLHCMNNDTKQYIQDVLLQCILCKTVQNQSKLKQHKLKD